jgi:putative ABC transport system permease protein
VPVSPGFFRATSLPLLRGRDFSTADTATSPAVIIINERMQARFWPDRDPVGEAFKLGDSESYRVVAVARDTKYRSLRETPRMTMYVPLAQSYESSVDVVVRSALAADVTVGSLRHAVRSVDADMPLFNVRTMAEHVDRSLYLDRVRARLIAWLAALALAVAAVGIYGVVSYTVAQRTREVGIRLALGAQPREILALLLGGGARLALAGIALGAPLSFWVTRGIAAQLYAISPADPIALGGAAALLFAVALAATYLPARRATRIDPMLAVRAE